MRSFARHALLALLLATSAPGAADVVRELVEVAAGDCDDGCEGPCTPIACPHPCCAHPTAVTFADDAAPAAGPPNAVAAAPEEAGTPGHTAPPFRPPAA